MTDLAGHLRRHIASVGPMPFEEFMAACLYDPDFGFFAVGGLRSTKGGDFLTSPEVSPWFGRIIARHVAEVTGGLLAPQIVEVAAGSGSLMRALLTELGLAHPPVTVVEASPAARDELATVDGIDRVVGDLDELAQPLEGVLIANELLDNLPVALVVRTGDVWEERLVGLEGDTLTLVAGPVRPEVAAWADAYAGTVPEGGMVEVQLAASRWIVEAVRRMSEGTVILFDYGGTAEELEPRRTLGTLRTYRNHHLGPDPLTAPGETDVTVDVNFTAMLAAATSDRTTATIMRQDDYLRSWGLGEEITSLRALEREHARGNDAMARLMVRSEITDAETLLHPRGLGDFRVLVIDVNTGVA